MASQTDEIQQLLLAEKSAAEKVTEAKKRKARRLKLAKDEAQVKLIFFVTQTKSIVWGYSFISQSKIKTMKWQPYSHFQLTTLTKKH